MTSYYYHGHNHSMHRVNAKRFNAPAYQLGGVSVESLVKPNSEDSVVFAADVLLLRNAYSYKTTSPAPVAEVWLTRQQTNSRWLADFMNQTCKYECPQGLSIAFVFLERGATQVVNDTLKIVEVVLPDDLVQLSDSVQKSALRTKAKTLAFFENLCPAAIDPGVNISFFAWQSNRANCVQNIISHEWPTVIIRSSCLSEDSFTTSNAGAFDSVMNVCGFDASAIERAMEDVFASYGSPTAEDEILIQQQVTDVSISGVCTTRVVGKGSPYYVISYDNTSGRTDSITAGDTASFETLYVARCADIGRANIEAEFKSLLISVQEIESLVDHSALDIEFIVSRDGKLHIVQIRPLVGEYNSSLDARIFSAVEDAKSQFNTLNTVDDGINKGRSTLLGLMPDANPAELIGIKPRPLAFSLYQKMITDEVVTVQRYEYGYRDVRPIKHMVRLGGSPYINVRSSFNSFTPREISEQTAEKLIDLYIQRLSTMLDLHDKVEFEVVATTWFPGVDHWFDEHYQEGLTGAEITEVISALKKIFRSALDNIDFLLKEVDAYQGKFERIEQSTVPPFEKALLLLETSRTYGCKPFAHLARSAFVAVSVLKGFKQVGMISSDEYNSFLHSVDSVSSGMEKDAFRVSSGEMSRADFYRTYGHLRPGTYDICSEAYFEDVEKYLDPAIRNAKPHEKMAKKVSSETYRNLDSYLLREVGVSYSQFDRFAKAAISGREFGKFRYTKFMSWGLHYLTLWGETIGLSRDDLSYLDYSDLICIGSGSMPNKKDYILGLISFRKQEFDCLSHVELPDVIKSSDDIEIFVRKAGRPNFITGKSISGSVVSLQQSDIQNSADLSGSVVFIESADPGFDWVFGLKVSGLVTKFGGANSHMAIRCAELGIPAAIGVGDLRYKSLVQSREVFIDCCNEVLKGI